MRRRSPVIGLLSAGAGKSRSAIAAKYAAARAAMQRGADPSDIRVHLSCAELLAFFRQLAPSSLWYSYFYIQLYYGCRLSEPALLLDADVDVRNKTIDIKRLKKAQDADGFRVCTYALDPRVLECVRAAQAWKRVQKTADNPFLFASQRRRSEDAVGSERLSQLRNLDGWQALSRFTAHRAFKGIAKHARIPHHLCHSHVLRHTRAVVLLALDVPEEQVQGLLSHSSLKMTQRYLAAADEARGTPELKALSRGGFGL